MKIAMVIHDQHKAYYVVYIHSLAVTVSVPITPGMDQPILGNVCHIDCIITLSVHDRPIRAPLLLV